MYQIPVRKSDNLKALTMLEMQGVLETRPEKDKPLSSVTLGTLTTNNNSSERCSLIIDRQKCEGKKQSIKKPLLLCKKVINPETNQVEYIAVGLVKEKILFRTRPTPLSPSPSASKTKSLEITENDSAAKKLFFSPKKKSTPTTSTNKK
ncbi:hypothetical protein ABK040_010575 [Willaertia magna]